MVARPLFGCVSPHNIRIVVVLPAPFGPRKPKMVPRSCLRTRFVLNLRQSRSGATGKERRENVARAADEESAFSRRPELLCRAGLACAAGGGVGPVEPGTTSGTEGVPAF